jgi:NADPH-dependent 2,4-dienoyl-CoA reductase/sulfur reductase-like enzyme
VSGDVVVVGAGLACARLIQALRSAGFDGRVTVVGDEPHLPYDRPPLSKSLLTDDADPAVPHLLTEPKAASVDWILDRPARSLDTAGKHVELAGGKLIRYDTAVVATGCRARTLPIAPPGYTLRTAEDAFRIRRELMARRGRLLLVGAGFIGSELAAAAVKRKWDVVVVDTAALPLQAALGQHAAKWLWQEHRARGIHTYFGTQVGEISEVGEGYLAVLDDGTEITADLLVAGIGTVPNVEWLQGSGLDISDGVRTDRSMRALTTTGETVDGVLAIGDVARSPTALSGNLPVRIEHWSTAGAHAAIAAATILDNPAANRSTPPTFWTDVYDHRIQVIGNPAAGEPGEPESGGKGFAVDFRANERLVGAVSVSWPARLVATHRALTAIRAD